jgi:O-antigen/teichoic acid export membrane protein
VATPGVDQIGDEPVSATERAIETGRFEARDAGDTLRRRATRGTVVNVVFLVVVNLIGFMKGYVIAAFLAPSEYGIWGLLVITLGTLLWLGQVGLDDKYIQQEHPDQEHAFQVAFTLQAMLCGAFFVFILAAMPLFALLYGRPEIIAPGYVLALSMPAIALQTPMWAYYRKMEYGKQRTLQAINPLVAAVVTIALAIAGMGYWALVIGTLVGSFVAAAVAVRASPYPIRLRYEHGSLRDYASFSWPLFAQSASAVVAAQVSIIVAQHSLGTAAVGAIALASTLSVYANQMNDLVTHAIYPAVCAVKDRTDLLFESFTKSNRMALLWSVPLGTGLALFAPDLVHYVLGDKWEFAIFLIQVVAITAALYQVGFNWSVFYRARGETRPIGVAGVVSLVTTLAVVIPLTIFEGLRGYAFGTAFVAAVSVVLRTYYLARLFPAFRVLGHSARAILPTLPALGVVLAVRNLESGRTFTTAILEVVLFVAVTLAFTLVAERALVREFIGYFRRVPAPAPTPAAGASA